MLKNCNTCGKATTNKKYCSKKCYYTSDNIVRFSSTYKKTLSDKMVELHKNMSKEEKLGRYKKISKSRTKELNSFTISKLETLLSLEYCYGFNNFSKHLGQSVRVISRIINDNKQYTKLRNRVPKYICKKIQLLSTAEYIKFLKEVEEVPWDIISNKYGFSKKNIITFCKSKGLKYVYKTPLNKISKLSTKKYNNFVKDVSTMSWDKVSHKYDIGRKSIIKFCEDNNLKYIFKPVNTGQTKPERFTEQVLLSENINFIAEAYIGKYICDFLIDDKIIEVQGDYWHANPKVFDHKFLNKAQRSNVNRDILKHAFYKKLGYKLLLVWEKDINNNKEFVIKKIKNYVRD